MSAYSLPRDLRGYSCTVFEGTVGMSEALDPGEIVVRLREEDIMKGPEKGAECLSIGL
jgi:hypothetical protein